MREFNLTFDVTVEACDLDELLEIIQRLERALKETEWKTKHVECVRSEVA